jgi:hypothetical protein
MRRDLQDTFIKLADATIVQAGRALEQGGWLRKTLDQNGAIPLIRLLVASMHC